MNEKQEQHPKSSAKELQVEDLQPKDLTPEEREKIKGGLQRSGSPEGHN